MREKWELKSKNFNFISESKAILLKLLQRRGPGFGTVTVTAAALPDNPSDSDFKTDSISTRSVFRIRSITGQLDPANLKLLVQYTTM